MSNDVADYTSSVVIQSGTVTISGTASVSIVGTPTVSISGTPTVNVGNTPAVTISSGTVTANISGTPNINIQSQSVNVNTAQPQTKLTDLAFPNGVSTQTTVAVPAGTHALGLWLASGNPNMTITAVKGHTTGNIYWPPNGVSPAAMGGGFGLEVPVDSIQDSQYDITATAGGASTLHVTAYLDTSVAYVTNTPLTRLYIAPALIAEQDQGGLLTQTQPYDASGTSAPAAGSKASVVLAATAGKKYRLAMYSFSEHAGVATALENTCSVLDGASAIVNEVLAIPATVGANARAAQSGLAVPGTVGNSMTATFANANGSDNQAVNIGAYLS